MLAAPRCQAVLATLLDRTAAMKILDQTKLDQTAKMMIHGGSSVRGAVTERLEADGSTLGSKANANSRMTKESRSGLAQDAPDDLLDNADTMNTQISQVNADGPRRSSGRA